MLPAPKMAGSLPTAGLGTHSHPRFLPTGTPTPHALPSPTYTSSDPTEPPLQPTPQRTGTRPYVSP